MESILLLRMIRKEVILKLRASEAKDIASKMLGHNLITKQSGAEGKPVNKVYICERLYLRREVYLAILLDRGHSGPVMVASSQGGMDIEAVAEKNPEKILKEYFSLDEGPKEEQLDSLASGMGFRGKSIDSVRISCVKVLLVIGKENHEELVSSFLGDRCHID